MAETNGFNSTSGMGLARMGLGAFAAAFLLGLGACAIKDGTEPGTDGGVVVSVNDSSSIDLTFDKTDPTVYTDSGEFNLDEIRTRMADKGINSDDVQITGLAVSYDEATKAFITANKGIPFVIKIYTRDGDGAPRKLTVESHEAVGDFKPLTFDPDAALYMLNKDIFGNAEGFPGLLTSIKDKSKHKVRVIAELTIKEALKVKGALKMNLVVTVAGKV